MKPIQSRQDLKRSLKALTELILRQDLHRWTLGRDRHVERYMNLFEGITPEIEASFGFFNWAQRVSALIVFPKRFIY